MTLGTMTGLNSAWQSVRGWLARVLLRRRDPPPAIVVEQAPAPPSVEPAVMVGTPPQFDDAETVEQFARKAFRTDFDSLPHLLDQLPRARRIVHKLASVDRDSYAIYRRLGARLVSNTNRLRWMSMGHLLGDFFEILPALGLVFVSTAHGKETSDDVEFVYVHFTKIERQPWDVEVPPGCRALYRVVTIGDDDDNDKKPWGYMFHVAVLGDRTTVALRERHCDVQHIASRRERGRSIKPATITLTQPARWAFPAALERHHRNFIKHHPDDWPARRSTAEFGAALFNGVANLYDDNTERFQITCERDGIALAFSIDGKRAPYFFRNRNIETTTSGKRRRIFHAVEQHDRTLANGRRVNVRSHYRGARAFEWKGERVRIAPPEQSAKFFNVGTVDEASVRPKEAVWHGPLVAEKVRGFWKQQAEERGGYRTRIANPVQVETDAIVDRFKKQALATERKEGPTPPCA